ncbi:hypothetical protein N8H69_16450 [Achromobacter spanius]|nr:hypothetical protein [Achromobacter spanius]MCW3154133.1 hypothetical protein [Achromobacter spanius]
MSTAVDAYDGKQPSPVGWVQRGTIVKIKQPSIARNPSANA